MEIERPKYKVNVEISCFCCCSFVLFMFLRLKFTNNDEIQAIRSLNNILSKTLSFNDNASAIFTILRCSHVQTSNNALCIVSTIDGTDFIVLYSSLLVRKYLYPKFNFSIALTRAPRSNTSAY